MRYGYLRVLEQLEMLESDSKEKLVVAVTMATGRQGIGVVKELSKQINTKYVLSQEI